MHYADVLFERFGDRVKRWITFNEPWIFCIDGYTTTKAPLIQAPGVGEYLCSHHMLQAHASAFHLYNDKYRQRQNGQIGISLFSNFFYPVEGTDAALAEQAQQFQLGWYMDPIFTKDGGYPKAMIDEIARKSAKEGNEVSRLPVMSDDMKASLIGSADFLGLNYYTSRMTKPLIDFSGPSNWQTDSGVDFIIDESWKKGKSWWLFSVPQGLFDLLNWIKVHYNNPTVLITENGYSDDGQLDDDDRIEYLKAHLAAISRAISENSCKVDAYTVWSIIDNFEWMVGYTEKFGIYAVNMTSASKERIPKKSVSFFKDFASSKKFEI